MFEENNLITLQDIIQPGTPAYDACMRGMQGTTFSGDLYAHLRLTLGIPDTYADQQQTTTSQKPIRIKEQDKEQNRLFISQAIARGMQGTSLTGDLYAPLREGLVLPLQKNAAYQTPTPVLIIDKEQNEQNILLALQRGMMKDNYIDNYRTGSTLALDSMF